MEPGQIWEIPKDWAVFIGGAAEVFAKITGRKGRFTAQTAKYACMHRWFSNEKLRMRTGYESRVGVEEGLERTVRWYKEDAEREDDKKRV